MLDPAQDRSRRGFMSCRGRSVSRSLIMSYSSSAAHHSSKQISMLWRIAHVNTMSSILAFDWMSI